MQVGGSEPNRSFRGLFGRRCAAVLTAGLVRSQHQGQDSPSAALRSAEDGATPSDGGGGGGGVVLGAFVMTAVTVGILGGLSWCLKLSYVHAGLAFGLQWAFFLLHGWPQRSEKLYDASGSLTHLAVILSALVADVQRTPRQLVVAVFSVVWCTRLGTFLFNRIARDAKDDRFTALKQNFFKFSIAWNFQAIWVFLLQLPIVITLLKVEQPMTGWMDGLGWSLWGIGFLAQSAADAQKFAFRSDPGNKGRFIRSGLWRYSRHPNYFGEILMWIGISLSCTSCFAGWEYLGWLSPAFDAFLLLFVSGVPMLEKSGEEKWGSDASYRHYMKYTSCIVPWFPAPKEEDSAANTGEGGEVDEEVVRT